MFSLPPGLKGRAPVRDGFRLDELADWLFEVERDYGPGKVFRLVQILYPEDHFEIGRIAHGLERGAVGLTQLRLPLMREHHPDAEFSRFCEERGNIPREVALAFVEIEPEGTAVVA